MITAKITMGSLTCDQALYHSGEGGHDTTVNQDIYNFKKKKTESGFSSDFLKNKRKLWSVS